MDGGCKFLMETCKRGHSREEPNVSHRARDRGYFQCKACVRAHATVQYHPCLKERLDEVANIHYDNLMGDNVRLDIGEIKYRLGS